MVDMSRRSLSERRLLILVGLSMGIKINIRATE